MLDLIKPSAEHVGRDRVDLQMPECLGKIDYVKAHLKERAVGLVVHKQNHQFLEIQIAVARNFAAREFALDAIYTCSLRVVKRRSCTPSTLLAGERKLLES